jgi:hypothetical protein
MGLGERSGVVGRGVYSVGWVKSAGRSYVVEMGFGLVVIFVDDW